MANPATRRRRPGPDPVPLEPLLAAASAVFAVSGYAEATVAAIAARGQTTKPTLYKHFGDKATLYRRCLEWELAYARDHLLSAYGQAEGLSMEEEITADVAAFFDYAAARPDGFRLLVELHDVGPAHRVREEFNETIVSRIAIRMGALTGLDPQSTSLRELAAMVVGSSVYAAREALIGLHADPQRSTDLAAAFIAGGLVRLAQDHADAEITRRGSRRP